MIGTVLLIWCGAKLAAPWWYWALLSIHIVLQIVKIGINIGKAAKDN